MQRAQNRVARSPNTTDSGISFEHVAAALVIKDSVMSHVSVNPALSHGASFLPALFQLSPSATMTCSGFPGVSDQQLKPGTTFLWFPVVELAATSQ